jgi:hyperosmotically inducible protein
MKRLYLLVAAAPLLFAAQASADYGYYPYAESNSYYDDSYPSSAQNSYYDSYPSSVQPVYPSSSQSAYFNGQYSQNPNLNRNSSFNDSNFNNSNMNRGYFDANTNTSAAAQQNAFPSQQSGSFANRIQAFASDQFATAEDRQLGDRIRRLIADNRIEPTTIRLNISNGMVTLRGRVNTDAIKSRLNDLIKNVDGVKQVDNQLQTSATDDQTSFNFNSNSSRLNQGSQFSNAADSQAAIQDTTGTTEDRALVQRIRTWLENDPTVSGSNIHVDASNGKVVIRGQVNSATQKNLIGHIIQQVSGVKSVDNELNIAK